MTLMHQSSNLIDSSWALLSQVTKALISKGYLNPLIVAYKPSAQKAKFKAI